MAVGGLNFSKNHISNTAGRDYFSALLRTHNSFIAPTQGKLLNYVERVPLGVVAQITVGKRCCPLADDLMILFYWEVALQPPTANRYQENCACSGGR